jgi:hypothetical protein
MLIDFIISRKLLCKVTIIICYLRCKICKEWNTCLASDWGKDEERMV